MAAMFYDSKFNNDISKWDVSSVENMSWMFSMSDFNRDISKWKVWRVHDYDGMFDASKIKEEYKPKFNK